MHGCMLQLEIWNDEKDNKSDKWLTKEHNVTGTCILGRPVVSH